MAQFAGGDVVSARRWRDALPQIAVLPTQVSVTNTAVLVDVSGLAVPLDPWGQYVLDGTVHYETAGVAALRVGLSSPPETFGSWATLGIVDGAGEASTTAGGLTGFRRSGFNVGDSVATQAGAGGADDAPLSLPILGTLWTRGFGGVLQLRFAQNAATASKTSIMPGSWLRLTKIRSAV